MASTTIATIAADIIFFILRRAVQPNPLKLSHTWPKIKITNRQKALRDGQKVNEKIFK